MTEEQLALLAQQGDTRVEDDLVRRRRGQAEAQAAKFYLPGGEPDDLRQEALIAVLGAVRSFDPARGVPFGAFCHACVRRRLADALIKARRGKHAVLDSAVREMQADSGRLVPSAELIHAPHSVEQLAEARGDIRRLRAALPRLSPLEARAVVGVALGFSYDELGPIRRIDNAFQRGRKKLEEIVA